MRGKNTKGLNLGEVTNAENGLTHDFEKGDGLGSGRGGGGGGGGGERRRI